MGITIIGSGDKGATAKLQGTLWWADNGWVHCSHPEEGHSQMRVKEALQRANALSDMLGKSSQQDLTRFADLRKEIQDFLDDIVQVCKAAREQGEYDDPSMARDRVRRQSQSVAVPQSFQLDL